MKYKENRFFTFGIVVCLTLIFSLTMLVVPYGDDFYYGTAFKRGYLAHKLFEYTKMNGRVIVHSLDELTLLFDVWGYRLIAPALLMVSAVLGVKGRKKETGIFAVLMMFMSLNTMLLRESYLWITGMFNYLYPIAVAFVCLYLFEEKERKRWHYLVAFAAGATTEQGGIAAIMLMLVPVIQRAVKTKEKISIADKKMVFASAVGFLTVATAPGVFARVASTGEMGMGEKLWANFSLRSSELLGEYGFLHIVIILFICIAIIGISDKAQRNSGYISVIGTALIIWIIKADMLQDTCAAVCIAVIICIFLISLNFLKGNEYLREGTYLLIALVCQGEMLPFAGSSYRTTFISAFFIILAAASMLGRLWQEKKTRAGAAVVLASVCLLAFGNFVPMFKGYYDNYSIHMVNIKETKEAESQKPIKISVPSNDICRFTAFYENNFYPQYYYMYYGRQKDSAYVWTGYEYKYIEAEGKTLKNVAYYYEKEWLFPLRELVESLGGTVDWSDSVTFVSLNGIDIKITDTECKDVKTNKRYYFLRRLEKTGIMYIEQKDFGEVFGFVSEIGSECIKIKEK